MWVLLQYLMGCRSLFWSKSHAPFLWWHIQPWSITEIIVQNWLRKSLQLQVQEGGLDPEQKVSLQHGFCWLCGREWSFWILEWKWISKANIRDFPEIQTLIIPRESYRVININRYLSKTSALREPNTGWGCSVPSWTERQWHWPVLLATQLFLPDNLLPEISTWGFSKAKFIFKLYRSKVLHFWDYFKPQSLQQAAARGSKRTKSPCC